MKTKHNIDMKEIYWIQRLDGACTFCEALIIVSIIVAILSCALYCIGSESLREEEQKLVQGFKRLCVTSVVMLTLSAFGRLFLPTTEEALIIYGVGGTIDYVQNNETLQQLPDKAVEALDLWVESLKAEDKR